MKEQKLKLVFLKVVKTFTVSYGTERLTASFGRAFNKMPTERTSVSH
jgi:hypothetical protein